MHFELILSSQFLNYRTLSRVFLSLSHCTPLFTCTFLLILIHFSSAIGGAPQLRQHNSSATQLPFPTLTSLYHSLSSWFACSSWLIISEHGDSETISRCLLLLPRCLSPIPPLSPSLAMKPSVSSQAMQKFSI